jgi:hypothetical protein
MNAIQQQMAYSIEQCILDHLSQDDNQESAVREAAAEIVRMISRPIFTSPYGATNGAVHPPERTPETEPLETAADREDAADCPVRRHVLPA